MSVLSLDHTSRRDNFFQFLFGIIEDNEEGIGKKQFDDEGTEDVEEEDQGEEENVEEEEEEEEHEIDGVGPSGSMVVTWSEPVPELSPPSTSNSSSSPVTPKKIPRPPNAFMIYASTWRRWLAKQNPAENNKQISIRLGKLWKEMSAVEKEHYFNLAKQADAEHKLKYPDYVYNPKEARIRKAHRERSRLSSQRWTLPGASRPVLLPIMLSGRREDRSVTMLQSYNEGYSDLSLSYGQHLHPSMAPHYHPQPWYNNYMHEHDNGSSEYLGRGEGKQTPDWSYRESAMPDPDPGYLQNQPPQESGYGSQEVGPMIPPMPMDSPLMGPVLQDPLMLPPESHNGAPLLQNGVDRLEPPPQPQAQPPKEEEESLPKLDGPQATPVESKKDVLKLPGFHQTFGNITEIGRFSQPDEFFESRPPEIPDPPPKVSESLEVKRKPRGRKRKQPEPRELYPRSEPPACSGGEPQWPAPPPHHWPPEPPHHWHRPHPYYHGGGQHYHHPPQYQQPPYYHHQHHLDCPPPYHYYQPTPWHPAARDYVHHHSYPGYV